MRTALPFRLACGLCLAATLLLAFAGAGHGEQPRLTTKVYFLPPGFFPDPNSPKELLENSGITFPEGSEAVLHKDSSVLCLRNTPENHELADFIFNATLDGEPGTQIAISLRTFECALPAKRSAQPFVPLEMADLRQIPQTDIKLLDQVATVTRSGLRASLRHTFSATAATSPKTETPQNREESLASFAPNEYGTKASVEPVVGADGLTIESKIEYLFRSASGPTEASDFTYVGSSVHIDGNPVVVFSTPCEDQSGKHLVVVASIQLITHDGHRVRNPGFPEKQAGQAP